MKKTNQENYFEGVTATAYFVGLLYRMIKDGEIFKSQTSYLPTDFDWLSFLDVEVSDDLSLELEQLLLQNAAAVAAVSWLEDQYTFELLTTQRAMVVERLSKSDIGQSQYFQNFLSMINVSNNYENVQKSVKDIYEKFVLEWWKNVPYKAPQSVGRKAPDIHF